MATESRVTTEGSHPFSTGHDLCLVHNGSLSNHNQLRANAAPRGDRVPDRERHRGRRRLPDVAAARGRLAGAGARGLPRRPRRLLHLPRRHGGRVRDPARPDRVQAGRARRDRRLGRDGLGVPRDRGAPGCSRRARIWEPEPSVVYAWEKARSRDGGRGCGRGRRSRGFLAARPQPAAARPRGRRPVTASASASTTRTGRTRSPAASTRRSTSRSRGTSATTAPG